MRVQKCYIAQRRTGEIVPARQVNMAESEEWRCHHCQCPLIFHHPTRTSPHGDNRKPFCSAPGWHQQVGNLPP